MKIVGIAERKYDFMFRANDSCVVVITNHKFGFGLIEEVAAKAVVFDWRIDAK